VLFESRSAFFYTKQLTKIVKTLNKLSEKIYLKNAREQKNLKTRELAQLGIDQALVSKFESGSRNLLKSRLSSSQQS
jgi:DNA-binding transcriptional regulator YiaG